MNETASVGNRVRMNMAYYNRDRIYDGQEGVVSSKMGHRYVVALDNGRSVVTANVTKLPATTRDRLIQLTPDALNISTLDGRRVQAAQAAKQILGDVSVAEITELAGFLAKTDDVAPATPSVSAGAIDTAAELERAKKIVDDGYHNNLQVWLDRSNDDDVVEIAGSYLKEQAVRDLIDFLQAALVVHKDLRSQATPF